MQCHCLCSKLLYHFHIFPLSRNPTKIAMEVWSVMIPSTVHLVDPVTGVAQQFSSRVLALWESPAAWSNTTMHWIQRKDWRAIFGFYVKYSAVIVEYTQATWAGAGFKVEESVSMFSHKDSAWTKSVQSKRLWCFTMWTGVSLHHLTKKLDGSLLHTVSQRHCIVHSTSLEFKPQKH